MYGHENELILNLNPYNVNHFRSISTPFSFYLGINIHSNCQILDFVWILLSGTVNPPPFLKLHHPLANSKPGCERGYSPPAFLFPSSTRIHFLLNCFC